MKPVVAPSAPTRLIAWGCVSIAAALFVLPLALDVAPAPTRATGLLVFAIGMWATGALPEYLTSICMFALAGVLAIAPPEAIFAGFRSQAVWLVFSGMVLGLAVLDSGLGARIVRVALPHGQAGYFGLAAGIALSGLALAFVVPAAIGRVMLLMPLVLAAADRLGFVPGSRGRAGLALAAGLGTTLPAFAILPANVPNMSLIGAAESVYGVQFSYGAYFALNFPVLGLLSLLAVPVLATLLFGETPAARRDEEAPPVWTAAERRVLAVLLLVLGLWASDALHGIAPAWIGLVGAVLCLLPLTGTLAATTALGRLNFGAWFFVAGVIGLGAIAAASGLGVAAGAAFLESFDPNGLNGAAAYAVMVAMAMAVGAVTTLPAAPAILTPLADPLAAATGWPLLSVLMTQVASWFVFPFPHEAPPVLVALAVGGVRMRDGLALLGTYFVFGVLVMLPLHYVWGRLLGVFP